MNKKEMTRLIEFGKVLTAILLISLPFWIGLIFSLARANFFYYILGAIGFLLIVWAFYLGRKVGIEEGAKP